MNAALDLQVGAMLPLKEVVITPERVQWYGDGMHSAATGKLTRAGENIHTDVAYAQGQGLTTAIADGMMSTAWINSVLTKAFGRNYLENGELRTKYIKTTDVGVKLKVLAKVRERENKPNGNVRFVLDVWTEDQAGVKLTDGDATVEVQKR
jgi:acyl dehydratase